MAFSARSSSTRLMRAARPLGALAAVAVMCAALPACTSMGRALGVEKVSPDEFAIVTKAPLVMPPDYGLRPPAPGAAPANQVPPSEVVAKTLTGGAMPASARRSPAENALLMKTGASEADPAIRAQLAADEPAQSEEEGESLTNRVMFWRGGEDSDDAAVDAAEEDERLKGTEGAGLPPTTGETPVEE